MYVRHALLCMRVCDCVYVVRPRAHAAVRARTARERTWHKVSTARGIEYGVHLCGPTPQCCFLHAHGLATSPFEADTQTDKQTNYCNPRCACTPRVNLSIHHFHFSIVYHLLSSFVNQSTFPEKPPKIFCARHMSAHVAYT